MKKMIAWALALVFCAAPAMVAAQMDELWMPTSREWGAVTGWDQRFPGVPAGVKNTVYQETFSRKYVNLAPGERFALAELEGPGIVSRIFVIAAPSVPKNNLRALVIRIYWDGEENPSVLSPLGDFFGAAFAKYTDYDAQPESMQGGGFVCRFPMPFHKSARIEVENGWTDKDAPLFYAIQYYKVPDLPAESLYFHALWRRENPTTRGVPYLVADITGRGKLVGVQLFLQNLSTFWYKGFNALMQPEGFGMGNLEGWEEIEVDGNTVEHGTGTEEYFNAGAYFIHTPYSGMYEGVHVRSYLTGRTSTYRFNVLDPIPFTRRLRMIWHHGPLDVVRADYAAIAYWYQSEPHSPQSIPDLPGRLPSSTLNHAAQALLIWPLVYGNRMVNEMIFE